ncbi:hypothetical protein H072_868 [Dactylellina haptotyla CBS 200.50]|uniref:t-SNARE coiled-coil homology domain-containing protein n=1 Tax=Dactylellina haptotyla (strain CBS 200.50) TaxID=1284197 RepID=S8AQ60_DACHA|nr:hypothetical protein H072_868 [Dactylellina haptotyla CBS 200.50]
MGWFSKKEKVASPSNDSPANPYASPPPAYDSGPNTKTYTDTKSNMSGGYGAPAPEPTGYGASTYGSAKPSGGANPYGSAKPSGGANPYGDANPYAAKQDNHHGGGGAYDNYSKGTGGYGASDGYSPNEPYSTGPNKQMTAEEEEEEDADALKGQIRYVKQESVNSTRNALRAAARAEEVGRDTLDRLGRQGEQLHNTEKNLDLAKAHGMQAQDQISHINRVNRSMFIPVAGSPFGRKARAEKEEQKIMDRHTSQRDEREKTNASGFAGQQAIKGGLRPMGGGLGGPRQKMSLAEKAKFQFEADEEDDRMEDEIDDNLGQLGDAVGRLNMLAKTTNQVVNDQNKVIERLSQKTEKVDDQLTRNTHRMNNIK